jgi:hypothetical protein
MRAAWYQKQGACFGSLCGMGHVRIQARPNILGHVRPWPKTLSDFASSEPGFLGISGRYFTLAAVDPFRLWRG